MGKKAKTAADPELRRAIRAELLAIHNQNQRIDRKAITAKYTTQKPKHAGYIQVIVREYEAAVNCTGVIRASANYCPATLAT
jgi:hypothetical protein